MSIDPHQIQVGMGVVGADGEEIGTVKEVRATDFLVDRPLARDVYVPMEYVQAIIDTTATSMFDLHVVLTIRAASVSDTGWPHP